jgi:hypothetical protein
LAQPPQTSPALDDPAYITGNGQPPDATAGTGNMVESANVAVLSVSAAASLLAQYVSLNVAPGGLGEPGPLQYLLSTHTLERQVSPGSGFPGLRCISAGPIVKSQPVALEKRTE